MIFKSEKEKEVFLVVLRRMKRKALRDRRQARSEADKEPDSDQRSIQEELAWVASMRRERIEDFQELAEKMHEGKY